MQKGTESKKQLNNQGFSLIEVLLCIAIISIVFLAIMNGFGVSMKLNLKANHLQVLTTFAQNILEEYKHVGDMEEVLLQYTGMMGEPTTDNSAYLALTPQQQALCTEDMFTVTTYQLQQVKIDGSGTYNLEVITNPLPYSQFIDDKTVNPSVQDANTFGTPNINQIDDANQVVIKDEISRYDTAVAEELQTLLPDDIKDGTEAQKTALKDAMEKAVIVTIQNSSNETLHVEAEVIYHSSYSGHTVEKRYVVYQSSYPIEIKTKRVIDPATKRPVKVFDRYLKGGSVFIFASAMNQIERNTIRIENKTTLENPITVCFLRGGSLNEANFNQVILADTLSESIYADVSMAGVDPKGIVAMHNMTFYSNVKGVQTDYIRQEDLDATLHDKSVAYRCHDVTVNIYDRDTGELVVTLTGTQEN